MSATACRSSRLSGLALFAAIFVYIAEESCTICSARRPSARVSRRFRWPGSLIGPLGCAVSTTEPWLAVLPGYPTQGGRCPSGGANWPPLRLRMGATRRLSPCRPVALSPKPIPRAQPFRHLSCSLRSSTAFCSRSHVTSSRSLRLASLSWLIRASFESSDMRCAEGTRRHLRGPLGRAIMFLASCRLGCGLPRPGATGPRSCPDEHAGH